MKPVLWLEMLRDRSVGLKQRRGRIDAKDRCEGWEDRLDLVRFDGYGWREGEGLDDKVGSGGDKRGRIGGENRMVKER